MTLSEVIQSIVLEKLASPDEIEKVGHGRWCRHMVSDLVPNLFQYPRRPACPMNVRMRRFVRFPGCCLTIWWKRRTGARDWFAFCGEIGPPRILQAAPPLHPLLVF